MVVFVKVESGDCRLIVNADDDSALWSEVVRRVVTASLTAWSSASYTSA